MELDVLVHCVRARESGHTGVISTPALGGFTVHISVVTGVAPSYTQTLGAPPGNEAKAPALAGPQSPYNTTVTL